MMRTGEYGDMVGTGNVVPGVGIGSAGTGNVVAGVDIGLAGGSNIVPGVGVGAAGGRLWGYEGFDYEAELEKLKEIREQGRRLFKARENILVSEWAERSRYVSRDESARPGQWRNDIVPFAVEIMDTFNDREIERVAVMSSAQVVKTEILKNFIGYVIENNPAPILCVYPSDGDARDFSSEKLKPMFRHNKGIRDRMAPERHGSDENKALFKKFDGAFLAIAGGRVPQDLARRSVKYVFADDRDRIGSAGNEGDAVEIAWQRTESYAIFGRKLYEFSTPTIDGISAIQKSYLASDQREYYVPCPECGLMQTLVFENLQWEKDVDVFGKTVKHYTDTVKYLCKGCGSLIDEKEKLGMLRGGKWVAKFPEIRSRRGYWINRLYSTFSGWKNLVDYFLKVKDDASELQVFYNTALGLTWKLTEEESIDETGLMSRCEEYYSGVDKRIPNEVLLLTCGVDVQPDRLEYQVAGFGKQGEGWHVEHGRLFGDPDLEDVWKDLDDVVRKKYLRMDGVEIGIRFRSGIDFPIMVDSGGANTQAVYRECQRRRGLGFIATKGSGGHDKPVLLNVSTVGKQRQFKLQNLGVDSAKSLIMKMVRVNMSPSRLHFNKDCDYEYFEQLTSEIQVIEYDKHNRRRVIWKKKSTHRRNEVFDMWVLNIAAMLKMVPNWGALETRYNEAAKIAGVVNNGSDSGGGSGEGLVGSGVGSSVGSTVGRQRRTTARRRLV